MMLVAAAVMDTVPDQVPGLQLASDQESVDPDDQAYHVVDGNDI